MGHFEAKNFKAIPLGLKDQGRLHAEHFEQSALKQGIVLPDDEAQKHDIIRLFCLSDFAARWCIRFPEWLIRFLQQGLANPHFAQDYRQELRPWLARASSQQETMNILRLFRHQALIRILWRFILGHVSLNDHFRELTELAEVIVQETQAWIFQQLTAQYGTPEEHGKAQPLVIIALGKLGGQELNFSSDLDLIFCYPNQGETKGQGSSLSHEEFYRKLAQQLLHMLCDITELGFVYRIDLRLRPHGVSGPLVLSFNAIETYYQIHGRDWERYALIKARVLTGEPKQRENLLHLLNPFVYRRYLDFSAFYSLQEMKLKVQHEVQRRNLQTNLKLGPGGIRQIEFLVQMFQLIRGGKEHQFQHPKLEVVLQRLMQAQVLNSKEGKQLLEAYAFLRRCEHILQMMKDEQTHDSPTSSLAQTRLSWLMGYKNFATFAQALKALTHRVQKQFDKISTPLSENKRPEDDIWNICHTIWNLLKDTQAHRKLAKKNHVDEIFFQTLLDFKKSNLVQSLRSQAQERLDRFMPNLLRELMPYEHKEEVLIRLIKLLRKVVRRSSYLVLMNENPRALERLVWLCSQSPWIANQMADYPMLIDELLSPFDESLASEKEVLAQALEDSLKWIKGDLDKQMERLRQFKLAFTLKVAIHELSTKQPFDVGQALTNLAEVILERIYQLSLAFVQQKFDLSELKEVQSPLGIIAYGNFGSGDLRYDSDLDLVFIYQHETQSDDLPQGFSIDNYYLRLAQRMIHMLSTQTLSGKLYEVDVRLRPGGSAGLLVTRFQAYAKYLQQDAWTWEHQALVRARLWMGDQALKQAFKKLRAQVLTQERSRESLTQAILDMRKKQVTQKTVSQTFDLKLSPGAIIDIEFIVQYYVLTYAQQNNELLELTKTQDLLRLLSKAGYLDAFWAITLELALNHYQGLLRLKLLKQEASLKEDEVGEWPQSVRAIWHQVFEVSLSGA